MSSGLQTQTQTSSPGYGHISLCIHITKFHHSFRPNGTFYYESLQAWQKVCCFDDKETY